MGSEFGFYTGVGDTGATNRGSQVIDVSVTPTVTVNGVTQAASPIVFQGAIETLPNGLYELVFESTGTQVCAVLDSCTITGNGNVVNNGQSIVNIGGQEYTELAVNGIDYAVQTTTIVGSSLPGFLNGYIGLVGVAVAPEPATLATTGLAAAFLGLFLRRKAKQNSEG